MAYFTSTLRPNLTPDCTISVNRNTVSFIKTYAIVSNIPADNSTVIRLLVIVNGQIAKLMAKTVATSLQIKYLN